MYECLTYPDGGNVPQTEVKYLFRVVKSADSPKPKWP